MHIVSSPNDFNELMKSNDLRIAIVGASMVDLYLNFLLTTIMVGNLKVCKGLLDSEQNGPLSSFAAKAKVAYALGLIDEQTKKDLDYIRKIRNEFAHSFKAISFQNSPIREYCNELSTAKRKKNEVQRLTSIYNQAIEENIERLKKRAAKELSKRNRI
jgi:DNA-binding MltR family transcriptional regulator